MANYRISPEAEADLYRIWLYGLETWGLDAADSYYHGFFEEFEAIGREPLRFQAVDEIREGYRRSVYNSDTIYFRIKGETVEIMRVIGRQDFA